MLLAADQSVVQRLAGGLAVRVVSFLDLGGLEAQDQDQEQDPEPKQNHQQEQDPKPEQDPKSPHQHRPRDREPNKQVVKQKTFSSIGFTTLRTI